MFPSSGATVQPFAGKRSYREASAIPRLIFTW
jgi:hypothetical protein